MTPTVSSSSHLLSLPTDGSPPLFTLITDPEPAQRVPYRAGYGSCYKCYCQAFEGSDWQCSNCGHHFDDHWTT